MDSAKVLGAQSQFFTHPQDLEKLENFMRELLENPGERRRITYRILRNDGSFVWCDRVSVNLLQDPAVQGIVSNFRDITEQIIYEEALRASNEELRKSNMELDKFVYSVSHDLRAPLSSMMGILNILELETEDGTVLEYTGMLRNSIRKLDGFISDILDYSRNARMAIEPQEIDINGLVDDITGNLKFMDTAYAVNVQVQVTGDFPMRSDRSRIAIILNNLISNAIRYHDPARGIPDVAVRLSTTAETCTIEVKDNGIGIEQKEQEKVFDMFYRVSNKSIGSGLGLYIVKETVEKLGGVIGLSSEPGVGTVVQITVPNLI
jgi:signal transduction histidine kinase